MMAVMIGIMIQVKEDGILSPSSLFFFIVAGQVIITGNFISAGNISSNILKDPCFRSASSSRNKGTDVWSGVLRNYSKHVYVVSHILAVQS